MTQKTLCFVAGKSGGHIIPCLTLAEMYRQEDSDLKILFFSTNALLDKHIISNNTYISCHISLPLQSIKGINFIDYIKIFFNIINSFIISFFYLWKYKPSTVITTGGVIALPVCYAAFILRIPIKIYCLDAIPGKAIKALSPFASSIYICFKNAHQFFKQAILVPYPIKYTNQDALITQKTACNNLNLQSNKQTIAILGGSQGSLFLNDYIKKLIVNSSFCCNTTQIIHQTGSLDTTNWKQFYNQHNVTAYVFNYQSNLTPIYAAADIIICRAGAGTLFEITFFNKKALIVPLKTNTTTHQIDNARAISHEYSHLFEWIDQQEIEKNPSLFFLKINKLLYR